MRYLRDVELPDGRIVDCFDWELDRLWEEAIELTPLEETMMERLRRQRQRDACPVRRDPGNYMEVEW